MTYQNARSGPNNVAEYQASGLPWVTASVATTTPRRIDFPYVTNQITFKATGTDVRFGFTQNGVNGSNYFTLAASQSLTMDVRTKQLWVMANSGSADFQLFAGLTMIDAKNFPVLTGSAVHNSASITFEYGYGIAGDPGAGTGLG